MSSSQHEILAWIQQLYGIVRFDIDVTYHTGRFYRNGIPEPVFKCDLFPRSRGVIPACATKVPFKNDVFNTVVFDPPFFAGTGKAGMIRYKYGSFETIDDLWEMYTLAMAEIKRILKPYGLLIFKCQDFISGRQQFLVHSDIISFAKSINFYPRDLFIKTSPHVPIAWNHNKQHHARKFHCYFIVFEKKVFPVRNIYSKKGGLANGRIEA